MGSSRSQKQKTFKRPIFISPNIFDVVIFYEYIMCLDYLLFDFIYVYDHEHLYFIRCIPNLQKLF